MIDSGYPAVAFAVGDELEKALAQIREFEAQLAEMKTRALTMEERWANANAEVKQLEAQRDEEYTLRKAEMKRAEKAEAALEEVEWVGCGCCHGCAWCGAEEREGHKPDCIRQAALSPRQPESEGE